MTLTTEAIRNFASGAVRSKDADETRYDLLTPIGLNALAEFYGGYLCPSEHPAKMLGESLDCIYTFLGGDQDPLLLSHAAACVAEVIAAENDEDREWMADTLVITDFEKEGYPYELIPFSFFRAIAETSGEGAAKYGDYNWEKGMPCHDILNHAIRHILLFISGDRSEPHLAHAGWNLLAAVHSFKLWPHLNTPHLRTAGCTPPSEAAKPEPIADPETEPETIEGLDRLETLHRIFPWLRGTLDDSGVTPKPLHSIPAIADFLANPETAIPPVLYVSGPMTGIDKFNFPAFNRAADQLRAAGFPVLNPADFGANPRYSWAECLQRDLAILAHADVVVRLPGWETSKGASLEVGTAGALGKGVTDLSVILEAI